MSPNPTRTLWISIGMALLSVFLIYSYSQEKKKEYDEKFGAMKQIVVAKKDILEMSTIDDTMVDIIEKPVDFVEPGAVSNPDDIIGWVAAVPIKNGEQILNTKVLKPGPNTGLSIQVSPAKRAVTLPVDEVRGVAKLVKPGDRIDLLALLETGSGGGKKSKMKTLLQDVPVLATGIRVTNNIPRAFELDNSKKGSFRNLNADTNFSTITLELSPREAQEVLYILASNPGALYMTLRNPNDRVKLNLNTTEINTLFGAPSHTFAKPIPRSPTNIVPTKPVRKKDRGPFKKIN